MSNNSGKKRAVIYSNVKANQRKAAEKEKIDKEKINLSDEYIIGLRDLPSRENLKKNNYSTKKEKNKKSKTKISKNKTNKKKQKLLPTAEMTRQQYLPSTKVKKQKKLPSTDLGRQRPVRNPKKKRKLNPKVKQKIIISIIAVIISTAIIFGIIAITRSSIFNIKEININIENNNVLVKSYIQEISGIRIGENMYAIKKKEIIDKIQTNPYIDSVSIKRTIPNKVDINVKERSVKFQIEENGQYIYVDNQGYILEQNEVPYDCIVIKGHVTEHLNNGEKLNKEDLERISDAFKIMQEVKNGGIEEPISSISIENKNDYLIYFDSVGKIAHLGNISSINDKIAYIKKILEIERDFEGEIFVNVDLNNGEYPFFREKV